MFTDVKNCLPFLNVNLSQELIKSYDIQSNIAELLITLGVFEGAVFNDRLPLSDGKITCKFPNLVLSRVVPSRENRIQCNHIQVSDTLQLTFRDTLENPRKNIVSQAQQIKKLLRVIRGNIGAVILQSVYFSKPRLIDESEVNLHRYDIDCTFVYYEI